MKFLILLLAIASLSGCPVATANETGSHPADRFGHPQQGLLLTRHGFMVGYDGLTRGPKWTLHKLTPSDLQGEHVDRKDEFRPDPKVPAEFRISLSHYEGSGLDRGHLVPSADLAGSRVDNSDTFFLSNMSPQWPKFNRGIWKKAEAQVRVLAGSDGVRETYVMSGALFIASLKGSIIIETFSDDSIPVPTHFFKSVLIVGKNGRLRSWSIIIPNAKEAIDGELQSFQVTVDEVESAAGLDLWPALADDVEAKLESKLESWK